MRTKIWLLVGLLAVFGLAERAQAEPSEPPISQDSATTGPSDTSPDQNVQSRGFPRIRALTAAEIATAKSVYQNTIVYDLVKVTDTLGLSGRPWTSNTPPIYTINVGEAYSSLTASDSRKRLLIHELAHVWQGQHLVPFMLDSAAHQTLSAILNDGNVAPAYTYTLGKLWREYNVEQQANIVTHWFVNGMKTTDARYRYIRDHIRKNLAF